MQCFVKLYDLQGYGDAIKMDSNDHVVPKELKGKVDILLGNMQEVYSFHSKVFLEDLKECKNTPALVGKCFINRVSLKLVLFCFIS